MSITVKEDKKYSGTITSLSQSSQHLKSKTKFSRFSFSWKPGREVPWLMTLGAKGPQVLSAASPCKLQYLIPALCLPLTLIICWLQYPDPSLVNQSSFLSGDCFTHGLWSISASILLKFIWHIISQLVLKVQYFCTWDYLVQIKHHKTTQTEEPWSLSLNIDSYERNEWYSWKVDLYWIRGQAHTYPKKPWAEAMGGWESGIWSFSFLLVLLVHRFMFKRCWGIPHFSLRWGATEHY